MHRSRPGILSVVGIVLGGFGCAAVCADELRVLGLLGGTPSAERFVEVAAGSHHALGLDALGAVHAWGWNGRAESSDDLPCGQGEAPPDLGPGRFVTALAAGVRHSMALLDDGSVACWGCEDEACDVPDDLVESPADPAVAIAAGERHSLALLASGSLRCWGESWENHGPCVIPSEAMDAGNPPIRIAAAWGISVALLADGTLVHWGWGDELQGVPDEPVERFALLQTQPVGGTFRWPPPRGPNR